MQLAANRIVSAAVLATIIALGCAEPTSAPRPIATQPGVAVDPPMRIPTISVSQVLSGLDARSANWADALKAAAAGDSTGFRSMRSFSGLPRWMQSDAKTPADAAPGGGASFDLTPPERPRFTTYSATTASTIYSSDTWPNLRTAATGSETSVGSYVLFLGQQATSTADYRVSTYGTRDNDYASAGSNSSAPNRIYSNSDCVSRQEATCPWVQQQDATFRLNGVPTCGVTLFARGNHETWFSDVQVSLGVGIISFQLTIQNPAQHDTRADTEKNAAGVRCGDEDYYSDAGSAEGCDGTVYTWYHDDGFGFQNMGDYCYYNGVFTHMDVAVVDGSALSSSAPDSPAKTLVGASSAAVTLAVSRLSDARVKILRRSGQTPAQVILVDERATPEDLASAFGGLGLMRAVEGDLIKADRALSLKDGARKAALSNTYAAKMSSYLSQLRRAASVAIEGVGTVAAMDVQLGRAPGIHQ